MKKKYFTGLFVALAILSFNLSAQNTATFDELTLTESGFWNGSNGEGGFTSGPAFFNNVYNSQYFSWSGFSYSNHTDTVTGTYQNQYAAITGEGVNASENYATGYVYFADTVELLTGEIPLGMYVTNATWPAIVMRDGDAFTEKFGGESGTDPDWFKLTVKGWNANDEFTGKVDFYLADFRFDDNTKDYILTQWQWVDLSNLGTVSYLTMGLSSSDIGDWGMNTPAYFCLDDFTTTTSFERVDFSEKELETESYFNGSDNRGGFGSQNLYFPNSYNTDWSSWTGWSYSSVTDNTTPGYTNQYSSVAGSGVHNTDIYSVSYGENTIHLSSEGTILGTYVTNNTYTALAMKYGDDYSKQFGGADGNDPDYFLLNITGYNNQGDSTGTKDVFLADYRFLDNSKDYILNDWKWVDLSSFENTRKLEFRLMSTDNGDWGMNTPAYFCLDGFTYQTLPEKEIKFSVNNGQNPIEGAQVEFNQVQMTTDFNGEAVFSSVSPTILMPYTVSYTGYIDSTGVINGFTDDEVTITLLPNSVNERVENQVNVYPNPAKDHIMVTANNKIVKIEVFTINGQKLITEKPWHTNVKLPIADLSAGVYFVKVTTKHNENIKKIYKN